MIKISCTKIFWVAAIFFGMVPLHGTSWKGRATAQLTVCVKNYNDRQSVLNAFQGQYGAHINVFDFHPVLPDECQIIDMYGNNVCYGLGVVHTIMVKVQYQGFRFLLQYMALPNGQMNNLVIPLPSQDLSSQN